MTRAAAARSPRFRSTRAATARVGSAASRAAAARAAAARSAPRTLRLPDGSRSASSPWVWRGLLFMSLIALGFCLTLLSGHHVAFAVCWGVIAAGWFAMSMWLWRKTLRA